MSMPAQSPFARCTAQTHAPSSTERACVTYNGSARLSQKPEARSNSQSERKQASKQSKIKRRKQGRRSCGEGQRSRESHADWRSLARLFFLFFSSLLFSLPPSLLPFTHSPPPFVITYSDTYLSISSLPLKNMPWQKPSPLAADV